MFYSINRVYLVSVVYSSICWYQISFFIPFPQLFYFYSISKRIQTRINTTATTLRNVSCHPVRSQYPNWGQSKKNFLRFFLPFIECCSWLFLLWLWVSECLYRMKKKITYPHIFSHYTTYIKLLFIDNKN